MERETGAIIREGERVAREAVAELSPDALLS